MKTDSDNELKTNPRGMYLQIIIGWIVVLLLCLLLSFVLGVLLSNLPVSRNFLIVMVWTILPLFWLIGSVQLYRGFKKGRYLLHDDSLIVEKGGVLGSSSKMYRYDSIVSVELKQDYFGKKYNYGSLLVTIPRLNTVVKLDAIDSPLTQAERLKAVTAQRSQTQSMIV